MWAGQVALQGAVPLRVIAKVDFSGIETASDVTKISNILVSIVNESEFIYADDKQRNRIINHIESIRSIVGENYKIKYCNIAFACVIEEKPDMATTEEV